AQFPPSNIWRISFSPSPATSMKRRLHSIASSFDLTSKSAKPAISSLVPVKGPSVTVNFPPEYRTRAPFELGMHPSVASSTPALVISSMSFPMLAIVSWLGGVPSGAAGRYSPKNFMLVLLVDRLGFRAGATSCRQPPSRASVQLPRRSRSRPARPVDAHLYRLPGLRRLD